MNMSGKKIIKTLILAATFLPAWTSSFGQSGAVSSHSPYSLFGVGDSVNEGTSYSKGMGGVGIASRNRKVVNTLNPAAVTARDSLSFMSDYGIAVNNKIYKQNDFKSGNNSCNINDVVISFPVYKSSAMMFGIAPYSGLGYEFSSYTDDDDLIGNIGNISMSSSGTGSIYQLFAAAGVTFWKKLSLGAEFIHYFGTLSKDNYVNFSGSGYNGLTSGYSMVLRANTAKFGLQYEQNIDNLTLGFGATYRLDASFSGSVTDYKISTGSVINDTLRYKVNDFSKDKVSIAGELGVGVSLRSGERWRAEVDYLTSDWTNTGIDDTKGFSNISNTVFKAARSQSVKAGFEFVPNVNDVRYYFRRCSYRAGAYLNDEYYMLDNNQIRSAGITLGMSFPIYKYHNALSLSIDMGQRGSLANNLIRERYINFTVGLNAFDIWFQKTRYN